MKAGLPIPGLIPLLSVSLISLQVAFFVPDASAVDEERLWLPLRYQKHYLNLKDAALAAENLNRCVVVLDGTIDLDQSTEAHPIFRIRCRQQNGRTYNEMVDGLTSETLTTPKSVDTGPSENELEQLRLAEEQRKLAQKQARIKHLWSLCYERFLLKAGLMINARGPKPENVPEPTFYEDDGEEDQTAAFTFDFEAEDASGGPLEFTAYCEVGTQQVLNLEFNRRQQVQTRVSERIEPINE